MLRIAICDDQPKELQIINEYITEYITKYLDNQSIETEMKEFDHPDSLLTAMEAESFHLYVLDIVMPMVSGIELGKEIRRLDREAQIIYTTTEPQYALQAYAASPINYLIKPIDKQQLFDTLTLAVSKIDLSQEQTFTVKTAESLRVLKLSDLLCCEYRNHAVSFTLANGEEVISRTIRESFGEYCSSILKDVRFLQCHTSYLINMRRVERFAKDSFTLRSGKVVPIAAKQYPVVRDQYMNFLMAKEVHR
ncbi:LytR/AlgR family response regulator transcription factor [Anaerocolumna sp. MB42-C2]|uniref:LytR/AlgR family response regulator transcription factor n=1 Tax=Anaerocolumna sp. MB42-C2 TaxID=3070997 RepID=UPI0027E11C83|nr:LytTR family DNA-binding domain-containing protein [Anaerocolumna sp. MB42-C2]WMJ85552.1 LytTR family DNA-binding domain-containing protein [Anaerocolumna sp. MB42-C2]